MATDRRRKPDEKVIPFADSEFRKGNIAEKKESPTPFEDAAFRKPSLDAGSLLDRRQFEQNLIRYNIIGRLTDLEDNVSIVTNATTVIQQTITTPQTTCYWEKVGDDVWYIPGDVYCGYNLIVENLSNSANPTIKIINNSDTAYDPILQFAVGATPVVQYTMGVDDSYDNHLTLCSGSALVETYAAGLLVDVYLDKSWIDIYPSVEVYNSFIAGDPNGNGTETYCTLSSYDTSAVLLGEINLYNDENGGGLDVVANRATYWDGGIFSLRPGWAELTTNGGVAGEDYVSINTDGGGCFSISTMAIADPIGSASFDMQSQDVANYANIQLITNTHDPTINHPEWNDEIELWSQNGWVTISAGKESHPDHQDMAYIIVEAGDKRVGQANRSFITLAASTDLIFDFNKDLEGLAELAATTVQPIFRITNQSATALDPVIQFALGATPVVKFTAGVDDSDSDKWKLSLGSALGTDDLLLASSAGLSTPLQFTSTLAIGTAPFAPTSTTVCANLNADLLDGYHATTFLSPKYIVQEANTDLSAEQSLGALATGILKNTTTAGVGVLSIAASADIVTIGGIRSFPPSTGYTIKNLYLNASKHIVVVYDETPIP